MNSKPIKIQVVEDDEWYSKLLVYSASLNPDYVVESFANGKEFLLQLPNSGVSIVTLDYRLPDMLGTEVLKQIKSFDPAIEVIVISEQQDISIAVELLKLGAYDYLVKEKDIRNKLINLLGNASRTLLLTEKVETLQKEVKSIYDFSQFIVGNSDVIKKVEETIEKSLKTMISVVISGETGTGKEVVAKCIHYNSIRSSGPFVPVNVAAIPSELIESELFGHEKGAFTGAVARYIGKFEAAAGGTLFLDEIAEMDISLQAKLLRVLQEKEVQRVGGTTRIKTDCRIIVASHRNLKEEVAKGNFREDLYYRLYGITIELPPLRERGNDILLLAKTFVAQFCKENKQKIKKISVQAEKKLLNYSFPGNVRELKAVMELAVVMSSTEVIEPDDVKLSSDDVLPNILSDETTMRQYELRILQTYLKKYNNDVKLVASKLDIGTATIYRMMKEL